MQYTIMAVAGLLIAAALALKTRLPIRPILALSLIAVVSQLVFDNIMTAAGLWQFDFSQTVGLAVPIIPVENLLFGLALALASVVAWEKSA